MEKFVLTVIIIYIRISEIEMNLQHLCYLMIYSKVSSKVSEKYKKAKYQYYQQNCFLCKYHYSDEGYGYSVAKCNLVSTFKSLKFQSRLECVKFFNFSYYRQEKFCFGFIPKLETNRIMCGFCKWLVHRYQFPVMIKMQKVKYRIKRQLTIIDFMNKLSYHQIWNPKIIL